MRRKMSQHQSTHLTKDSTCIKLSTNKTVFLLKHRLKRAIHRSPWRGEIDKIS